MPFNKLINGIYNICTYSRPQTHSISGHHLDPSPEVVDLPYKGNWSPEGTPNGTPNPLHIWTPFEDIIYPFLDDLIPY